MGRFSVLEMFMHPLQNPQTRPQSEIKLGSPCSACEIREIAVCSVLSDLELERLRAIISTVHCDGGKTIITEGDPAENVFNVVSGTAKLYKLLPDGRRQITGFMFPGDFLGIALNETYAYSAEAVAKVQLCRFPRRKLEALLEEFPKLERRLLGEAASELVVAQDQMLLLGRKTAKEKVASFLVMLADRAARRGRAAHLIDVPMSRADIADYLGLTTETVSRTITQLKVSKVIAVPNRAQIQISRREALSELMGNG